MGLKARKADLEAKYVRIIKIFKNDSDVTNAQIIERFGIGLKKTKVLREQAIQEMKFNELP